MSIPGKNVGSEILDSIERLLDHHREQCSEPSTRQLIEVVVTRLGKIEVQQERIMAGIDDLKAAVSGIVQGVADLNALVEQVVAKLKAGGLSDADAEALAVQLQGGIAAITDETAKLNQD